MHDWRATVRRVEMADGGLRRRDPTPGGVACVRGRGASVTDSPVCRAG
jgi:hypothetical protein